MAHEQTKMNFNFDDNFDEEQRETFANAIHSLIEAQVIEKTGTLNVTFAWEDNA